MFTARAHRLTAVFALVSLLSTYVHTSVGFLQAYEQLIASSTATAQGLQSPIFRGNFQRESAEPKYEKTWIASITCRTMNGGTQTYGGGRWAPFDITNLVVDAIEQRGLSVSPPTRGSAIVMSDGASGEGLQWTSFGTVHQPTVEAVCQILGHDSYVSSSCVWQNPDGDEYPNGMCNYHTPGDNAMYRFVSSGRASQCGDGIDNDGDGKVDFPNDPGCENKTDDDERDTTCPDSSPQQPQRRTIDGPFALRGELNRLGASQGKTFIPDQFQNSAAVHKDQSSAQLACEILGFDRVVSFSGNSTEYGSRDYFDSCHDNAMAYAVGNDWQIRSACDGNNWIGTLTCDRSTPACPIDSDVLVVKSASSQTVQEGETITYTVSVRNIGQAKTVNTRVSDTMPNGFTFVSASPSNLCSLQGNTIACTGFELDPGETEEFRFVLRANASMGQCVDRNAQNTAIVRAQNDKTPNNNTSNTVVTSVICPTTDLSIEKNTRATSVRPGDTVTYDVKVRNIGQLTANGIIVRDLVPANLEFVSHSGVQVCQVINNTVQCDFGTLDRNASRVVGLTFRVHDNQQCVATTIQNVATVTSSTTDSNQGNNTSNTVSTALTCPPTTADLDITKTANRQSVQPGDQITYEIRVRNNGPAAAADVLVRDTLASALEFQSSNGAFCQLVGGVVNCALGTLNAHQERSFTITVRVRDQQACAPSTIQNSAIVTSGTSDPSNGNNTSATVSTNLTCPQPQTADLRVTKSSSPTTVQEGQNLTFALVVENIGQAASANAVLVDTIPAGLTYQATHSDSRCSQQSNQIRCQNFTVQPGQSQTFNLVFGVEQTQSCVARFIQNMATVSAQNDPTTGNNSSNSVITNITCVTPTADLSITKTTNVTAVQRGSAITYVVTALNAGPAAATNVAIADVVPTGLTFVPASSSPQCHLHQQSNSVVCDNFSLAPGQPRSFSIVFTVGHSLECNSTLQNRASVSTSVTDPNSHNNQSSIVNTTVSCPAETPDISITKTTSHSTVQRGGTITYRLTVNNAGPGVADGILLTDSIPSGLAFVSSSDPICLQQGGNIICQRFSLSAGSSRVFELTFGVSHDFACNGHIQNTASASISTDPNQGNNQSTVTTMVSCPVQHPDVTIEKTGPSSVQDGDVITYILTARNIGQGVAQGPVISDVMPTGVDYLPHLSDSRCRQQGSTVRCTNFTLNSGQVETFTLRFQDRVSQNVCAPHSTVNVASITDPQDQTSSNNTSATIATSITCPQQTADLSIEKTLTDPQQAVTPGSTMSYRLRVRNNGPATATNIGASDVVPAGLTFNAHFSDPRCVLHNGSVVCNNFNLASGEIKDITVVFNVPATHQCNATISNQASVSAATPTDPNPANNQSAVVTKSVICPTPTFAVTKTDNVVTAQPGQTLNYTITITNTSTFAASNFTATDSLPAHTTFVSASDGGTLTDTIVTWTGISVAPGAQKILSLQVRVNNNAPQGAVLENIAKVGDISGADVTTVQQPLPVSADLSIIKTAHQTSVHRGGVVTYTLTVFNAGPGVGTNLAVADVVPANLTFDQSQSDSACYLHQATSSVVCDNFQLSSGQSRSFQVRFRVGETATCNTVINNNASISTSATDPNPGNNQSQTVTTVVNCPQATLSISKTDNKTTVAPGEQLTYTITLQNTSNVNATNITVTDTLPSEVDFVSATDAGVRAGQTITWSNLSVAAGGTKTLIVVATVKQNVANNTVLTNRVEIPGGVSATDTTTVIATQPSSADLSITKSKVSTDSTMQPGGSIVYSLVVSNAGPGVGTNLIVADVVPANLTFTAAGSDQGCRFHSVANSVICDNFSLHAGQSRTFLVKFDLAASTSCSAATIQNSATIATSATDPNTSNNISNVVSTPVQCVPGLSVSKTDNRSTVAPGETLTYSITLLNTSNVAQTTTVRDTLSSLTSFVSATDGGLVNGQVVTWENITVSPNSSRVLTLNARVSTTAQNGTAITNNVMITTGTSAADTTTVQGPSGTGAHLTIDIIDNPDPVEADEDLTYTIRLTNLRNTPTVAFTVTQVLPSDVDAESISDGGTEHGNVVTWTGIVIPANSTRELVVRVHVDEDAEEDDVLLTTVFANGASDTETTRVDDGDRDDKDIEVSITDSKDPVAPGDTLTYYITIENNGDDDVEVDVDGFLDDNTTFVSASDDGERESGDRVEWQDIEIDEDDSVTLTLTVRVDQDAQDGDRLRFRARAEDEEDSEFTDVRIAAQPAGPVSVTVDKQSDRSEAFPGDEIFYTITITNTSTVKASSITIEDSFPIQDLTVTNIDGGGQMSANGTIVWTIPMLEAGQSHTVRYSARISSALRLGQIVRNTVSVRSPDFPQGFADTHEVRIIEMLPQTGGFSLISGMTDTHQYMTSPKGNAAAVAASLPVIIWTTIMAIGMGTGTLIGRRFFFI